MLNKKLKTASHQVSPLAVLVRERMRKAGFTSDQLCRAAGLARSSLSKILNSQIRASADMALRLARGLRLPGADVLAAAGHRHLAAHFRERNNTLQEEFQRLSRLMGITLLSAETFAGLNEDDQQAIVSQLVALKLLSDRLLRQPARDAGVTCQCSIRATVVHESV